MRIKSEEIVEIIERLIWVHQATLRAEKKRLVKLADLPIDEFTGYDIGVFELLSKNIRNRDWIVSELESLLDEIHDKEKVLQQEVNAE